MKRLITICAVVAVVLVAGSVRAATIRDHIPYIASSNLTLGALDATKGYAITADFQLNLEYQAGIPDTAIDALNAYDPDGTWTVNYSDNEYYYLKVDTSGGLPIGIYDFISSPAVQAYSPDSGGPLVKWTLSYWEGDLFQTILAGDIVDDPVLRIQPIAGYRSFLGTGLANNVEVFAGATIDCEVLGYSFTSPIGTGSVLTPNLVPEPATIALLGLGALSLIRRKR